MSNVEFFPIMQTEVEVRYWDKAENTLISSEKLTGEKVVGNEETQITAHIKIPEGYKTDGWNVQLLDGTIQYEGVENPTTITLNGYLLVLRLQQHHLSCTHSHALRHLLRPSLHQSF